MSYNQTPPQGATGTQAPATPPALDSSAWLADAQQRIETSQGRVDQIQTQLDQLNTAMLKLDPGDPNSPQNVDIVKGYQAQIAALTQQQQAEKAYIATYAPIIRDALKSQMNGTDKAKAQEATSQAAYYDALAKKAQLDAQVASDPTNQMLKQQDDAATRDLHQLDATHQRIVNSFAAAKEQADLDKMVTDNTLTQAQADQINAGLKAGDPNATVKLKQAQADDAVANGQLSRARADDIKARLAAGDPQADVDLKNAQANNQNSQAGLNLANATESGARTADLNAKNASDYWGGQKALADAQTANQQAQAADQQLKTQQLKEGDLGTLIDQAEESIRKGLLTPMAATTQLFNSIHGSTPFQRENQASANALSVFQTAAQQGMLGVPGQQYLNPDAAPGGGYEKAFARAGVQYTPMNISQGASTLPAFAQSMNIPTTPAQPQAPWFSPQGSVLPAFAQGMSGGVGPDGGMLLSPDAARAMLRAGQPQAQQPQMGVAA